MRHPLKLFKTLIISKQISHSLFVSISTAQNLNNIFLVLTEKPSFFGRNTSFEGLKGHFICCTTSFYCPFTNMPSLNSKLQICHPNFVYGQFFGNFLQFWASWWKYGVILTTSGCLKQNLIL